MKAEIKFAITKNGPKAFMSTYNDDWTPANDTRLRVYKKDKRSVTPANAYPEGKGYALAINPWVLQDFLEVNGIDAMQPMTIAKGLAPELRDIRYANDSEIVWYEFSTCNTTKRCTNLSRAKNFVRIGSITIARLCTATPRTRRMSLSMDSALRCRYSATCLSILMIASSSWMIP